MTLLVTLTTATAWAQSTFGGGSGTQADPYIIKTNDHMRQLATDVNNGNEYSDCYFRLDNDLDFAGESYTPIGAYVGDVSSSGYFAFEGFFDGNHCTIRNVTINQPGSYGVGLFGMAAVWSIIKDLTLANSTIKGKSGVGGIVGRMMGGTTRTDRGIRNCTVADDVTISGEKLVGGIVGWLEAPYVDGCRFFGTATATQNSYVGGIAGGALGGDYITSCFVGGKCTLGALGAENSATGTDEGVGAKHICTVSFADGVSGTFASSYILRVGLTTYYECQTAITLQLAYTGAAAEGCTARFAVSDGTLTPTTTAYSLLLPLASNVTVSAQTDNTLLDIAYHTVTITIPDQEYTGSQLTPVVTVTDTRSGTAETLVEGTDYSVVLPDGDCIYAGDYNVGIVGMGRYAGRATATFHIYHPVFAKGSGSETDPFIIDSTDEMDKLAAHVNMGDNLSGLYFKQQGDLDYAGKTYTPVSDAYLRPFCGHFNGASYTIKNVTVNGGKSYVGLFGTLGSEGTIENVTLAASSISGNMYVGGIVGSANGNVTSCHVKDDVTVGGGREIGGIAGSTSATVSNCYNEAAVSAGETNVGGITGVANSATITGCINDGAVSSSNSSAGGITGRASIATFEFCVNTATVSGERYIGGIVGITWEGGSVSNCLNLGAVTASDIRGGGVAGELGSTTMIRSNHYAGKCATGGVNGSDVAGACQGWKVTADENIYFDLAPDGEDLFTGYSHEGITYLGAGETSFMQISRGYEFSGYTLTVSAGTLTAVEGEDDMYTLTMPTTGQDVNISLTGTLTLNLLDDDSNEWYDNARRLTENVGFTGSVCLSGRTLYKDGDWNTICLPFDITISGSALDGNGVEVRTLNSSAFENGTLTMNFTPATGEDAVTTMEAGKPYIIKWKKPSGYVPYADPATDADAYAAWLATEPDKRDIHDPIFTSVTVSSTAAATTTASSDYVDFRGTYSPVGIYESGTNKYNLYLGSGNTLYYPTAEDFKVNACRGWFVLKNGLTCGTPASPGTQNSVRAFNFSFGGEETGISEAAPLNDKGQMINDRWYNLNGVKIDKPVRKGLYIRNGKKVVVK